jgi:hypothetical protein
MKLEKNKVYKIKHPTVHGYPHGRNYIICAFKNDIAINDNFFEKYNPCKWEKEIWVSSSIDTVFTSCFSGEIMIADTVEADNPTGSSQTGISNFCTFLPIEEKDYEDIRKAIGMLGKGYRYNRKLNIITYDTKSKTSI